MRVFESKEQFTSINECSQAQPRLSQENRIHTAANEKKTQISPSTCDHSPLVRTPILIVWFLFTFNSKGKVTLHYFLSGHFTCLDMKNVFSHRNGR